MIKIFYNANIYSPDHPGATAFAVDKDQFLAFGSNEQILDCSQSAERVINLQRKTVWPGLTDSHVHLRSLADSMEIVNCETNSIELCLKRVKEAANKLSKNTWLRGHGWNQNKWASGFGSANILDKVTGNHPAYLTAKSLHAAWVNSKALELAGIDRDTPDPPSGIIQRDHSGNPTGILLESGAMSLVESIIPKPSINEIITRVRTLIPKLWQMGLIGVHDFDGYDCWQALKRINEDQDTPFRIRKSIPFDHFDDFIQAGIRTDDGSDMLQIGSLKLFSDGALGPQTAAMKKPFDSSKNFGELLLSEEEIFQTGVKAVNHGIALSIHAIGDRANETVINALKRLRNYEKTNNLPVYKHRIEHVQIIDNKDIPRMKNLNITASVQPIHATSDIEIAEKYLGNRSKNAYTFHSLMTHGVGMIFGSDAPVESVNPFYGLHAAITRRRLDGSPGPNGWHPEQRLSIDQALLGYSLSPALISLHETKLGKIAAGYKADFIILNQDPFVIDPQDIAMLKPAATFINGNCVFKDDTIELDI